MSNVTHILAAIDAGDPQAASELLPLVYDELRRLAAASMAREKPGQTLDATALVHEAYLRLVRGNGARESTDAPGPEGLPTFANRRHFFAAAAEAMRRILVEAARRKKPGSGTEAALQRADLPDDGPAVELRVDDVVAVDEALEKLAAADAQAAELVKLHYFAGLTIDQTADVLGVSVRKAYTIWAYARAWLFRSLGGEEAGR